MFKVIEKKGLVSSELEDTLFAVFDIMFAPIIADFQFAMIGSFLDAVYTLA